jgi:hypothetical protein
MKEFIKYQVNGRYVEIPADYSHLIQMKTRKEIAAEYRISIKVLRERLSSCGMKQSSKKIGNSFMWQIYVNPLFLA